MNRICFLEYVNSKHASTENVKILNSNFPNNSYRLEEGVDYQARL